MRKRCAIIGIGHRAHSWLGGIVERHPRHAELVGLCDPNLDRCRDANAAYGTSAGVYDDHARMLAEVKPDLVIVTTPETMHRAHIVSALDAGCAVATEKPLCITCADAAAILDAEQRNGRSVFMAFNYRHIPLCHHIWKLVQQGAIGTPISMDLTWYLDYRGHGASYFRRWHRHLAESGGLLITKACHHFDLANWWMNDRPAAVYALGRQNAFGPGHNPYTGVRCSTCEHGRVCSWYTDVCVRDRSAEMSRQLGYKVKRVRDYANDWCPFGADVDICDTMAVTVQYRNGGILNYSLNATVPFEGWNLAINGTGGRLESRITDAKPAAPWVPQDWRKQYRGKEVEWPAEYRIFVMPHDREAFEITVPNIADGHGGGDWRIFQAVFTGEIEDDARGSFAQTIDGAMSTAIGDAANQSIATGKPVQVRDLLGKWW